MSVTGNVEPLIFGCFVETGLHGYDVTIVTYKLRRLVCRRHPDCLMAAPSYPEHCYRKQFQFDKKTGAEAGLVLVIMHGCTYQSVGMVVQ